MRRVAFTLGLSVRHEQRSGAWVEEEFESLDLGNSRRDRRAKALLKRLAALPAARIPGACKGWTETTAAYRFLGNE